VEEFTHAIEKAKAFFYRAKQGTVDAIGVALCVALSKSLERFFQLSIYATRLSEIEESLIWSLNPFSRWIAPLSNRDPLTRVNR
jgi:hypothetical protein